MSEKQGSKATAYKNQYNYKNYDALRIVVPKGRKSDIESYTRDKGQSVNGLVNELLRGEMGLSQAEWKAGSADE